MTENQTLALRLALRQHGPTLLAVLALLLAAWLWQRGNNAIAEAANLRARVNLAATIDEEQRKLDAIHAKLAAAEKRLGEVAAREASLYPEIERKKAEAGKLLATIRARQNELALMDAREVGPPVPQPLTDQELVTGFAALGYTVTPLSECGP